MKKVPGKFENLHTHLSKTAMRKVRTGARLVKVIANVAVVYCNP